VDFRPALTVMAALLGLPYGGGERKNVLRVPLIKTFRKKIKKIEFYFLTRQKTMAYHKKCFATTTTEAQQGCQRDFARNEFRCQRLILSPVPRMSSASG